MKTALITGASGVIGSACAYALANKGYALGLQYNLHPENMQKLLNTLPHATSVAAVCADISKEKDILQLFKTIETRLGLIDLLVNCAGVALPQKVLLDVDESEIQHVFSINVIGPMLLTKASIPHMLKKGGGAIIHISSMWGIIGASCESVYSSSKAALNGFVKSMAKELAPAGVRVNSVAPGLVRSPMNSSLSEQDILSFQQDTPLGQVVTPEQVAEAVCYLAEAQMVTGQILSVDGGIVI